MSTPKKPFYPMTHDDAVEMNENLKSIAIGMNGTRLDNLFRSLVSGENTTRLFKDWWSFAYSDGADRYTMLSRWFRIISEAWDDKFYTLRWPYYTENTTGATGATPLADLAGKRPAVCATENTADEFDWADEDPVTWYVRANALSLADGTMNIIAIEGIDDSFDLTGETAPVYTFSNALWVAHYQDGTYEYKTFATKRGSGMRPFAGDVDPSNGKRDMTWHPTFDGQVIFKDLVAYLTSGTGGKPAIRRSMNQGLTDCRRWNAYEGLMSDTDVDWLLSMFQLRHFDLENSGIIEGCLNYNFQYTVAVAEENVRSVVLTTAQAANLLVGSSVCVGTHPSGTNNDRNTAANYDLVDIAKITAITEEVIGGTTYARVTLDIDDDITVPATGYVSTMPWFAGSTEGLPGHKDGSIGSCTNGKAPARIAGIEIIAGAYSIGADPIWNSDYNASRSPKSIYTVYQVRDSEHQAGSITANHESVGTFQSEDTGWQYEKHLAINDKGMIYPDALGASTTTFMKSAFIFVASSGLRAPWRFLDLSSGGLGGLAGARGSATPSLASWLGRPRLSGAGKKRGEWQDANAA